jgi:hypothetical protein
MADTIVYQDAIKRITAHGNVKYYDKDGQMLLCGGLVFHNDYDFMEVSGGASATIRLPAKFANDINQTLADVREEEAPEQLTDPPVPEEVPRRNPNEGSTLDQGLRPLELPAAVEAGTGEGITPLPIPGQDGAPVEPETAPVERTIELGEDTILEIFQEGFIPDEDEAESAADEAAATEAEGEEDNGG